MPTVLITPEAYLHQDLPHVPVLREAGFDIRYPRDPQFTRGFASVEETIAELRGAAAVLAGGEVISAGVLAGVPEAPDAESAAKPKRPKPTKPGDVAPPMPGRVVKILVSEGSTVTTGDALLIIEAMKMESRVPAPIDGRVVAVLVSEGENVKTDETLIQLE